MASVEIALVCGLKVRVGCQNRLCVNSDADETFSEFPDSNFTLFLSESINFELRLTVLNFCQFFTSFVFNLFFDFESINVSYGYHVSKTVLFPMLCLLE